MVAFVLSRWKWRGKKNWSKEAFGQTFSKVILKLGGKPQWPDQLGAKERTPEWLIRNTLPRASHSEGHDIMLRVTLQIQCTARPFCSIQSIIRCLFIEKSRIVGKAKGFYKGFYKPLAYKGLWAGKHVFGLIEFLSSPQAQQSLSCKDSWIFPHLQERTCMYLASPQTQARGEVGRIKEGAVSGGVPSPSAGAALCVTLVLQGHQVQLAFWGSTTLGKHVL